MWTLLLVAYGQMYTRPEDVSLAEAAVCAGVSGATFAVNMLCTPVVLCFD